jgi:predicted PurR-regulated permease PerM
LSVPYTYDSLYMNTLSSQERNAGAVSAAVSLSLLFAALLLHLIPALFSGMLVFFLVHALAASLERHIEGRRGRLWATGLIAVVVVSILALCLAGLLTLVNRPGSGFDQLWEHLVTSMHGGESFLPSWVTQGFPVNATDLKAIVMRWLNLHASELSLFGKETGVTLAQVLIAMVIGGMVATREADMPQKISPLTKALLTRARRIQEAFSDVVGAQFKIALINATLTGFFLAVFLPAAGIELPLVKTLVLITFVVGMVPVLGNVVSNSLIVLVSLSVSLMAAILSLGFLIALHKGEYFLNARIVGRRIDARSWELLTAILVMEAAFGLPGIAAAPIYYAYLKRELTDLRWI